MYDHQISKLLLLLNDMPLVHRHSKTHSKVDGPPISGRTLPHQWWVISNVPMHAVGVRWSRRSNVGGGGRRKHGSIGSFPPFAFRGRRCLPRWCEAHQLTLLGSCGCTSCDIVQWRGGYYPPLNRTPLPSLVVMAVASGCCAS